MNSHSRLDLLGKLMARAAKRAEAGDGDLICPSCGYKAPEAEFEPDSNEDSDNFRTDDVTSESGQDDEDDEGDGADLPEYDNLRRPIVRLTALQRRLAAAANKSSNH